MQYGPEVSAPDITLIEVWRAIKHRKDNLLRFFLTVLVSRQWPNQLAEEQKIRIISEYLRLREEQ